MTTSHADFDALLMRDGKQVPTRKIANNTYAQRRGNDIAVMLHATDIITFHDDGTITLNTGGWLTMVTKERMNRYLPAEVQVHSVKGRWRVTTRMVISSCTGGYYTHPDWTNDTAFHDGMKLARVSTLASGGNVWVVANGLSPEAEKRQDAHNRRVEKLIDAYLAYLDQDTYDDMFQSSTRSVADAGGCGMCVRTGVGTLVGDAFEDKQHLIEHLIDKRVPFSVFHVACDHVRGDDGLYRARHFDLAKRDLHKYLRGVLYVGEVATKGGKRPAHTQPWALARQLKKKVPA